MNATQRITDDMPSRADVLECLKDIRAYAKRMGDDVDDIDVRLQVIESEGWAFHSGLSDYDTDHRGFWGAESVRGDDSDESLVYIAQELIRQCEDSAAM